MALEILPEVFAAGRTAWSGFALLDPYEGIPRQGRNVSEAVHQQIAIVVQPDTFPRQRSGCRAFDLVARLVAILGVNVELASVAGASDDPQLWLPGRKTSEMRAHRTQREVALLGVNDVDSRVRVKRDRVQRIAVRVAFIDHGRRLVEYVRLEILIGERDRAGSGDAQRAQSESEEELTAVQIVCLLCVRAVPTLCHAPRSSPS